MPLDATLDLDELPLLPRREGLCDRQLVYLDGLVWRCACSASGPVGRSEDGIPYVNDEILAHAPGEDRS